MMCVRWDICSEDQEVVECDGFEESAEVKYFRGERKMV